MSQKPYQRTLLRIILISVFLALARSAYPYSNWQMYKDDDGSLDSNWGCSSGPGTVLCKTFMLDDVKNVRDAIIQYEMAANPWHCQRKASFCPETRDSGAQWEWNDMVILVNDEVAARGSPIELGSKGWHRVKIAPKLLKSGKNTVKFTWAGEGAEGGRGLFYLGIDTATHKERSSASGNWGKSFTTQCLNPTSGERLPVNQGEYMVRLNVAYSSQPAAFQSTDSTNVEANMPVVRQFYSFNDSPDGGITDTNITAISGGKCQVKIINLPTWEYFNREYTSGDSEGHCYSENRGMSASEWHDMRNKGACFVPDKCVELLNENENAGKQAVITFPVPEMKQGLIEFDLMAENYKGGGLRVRLGDNSGLWINKEGDYYWQAGTNTIKLLDRCQLIPSMGPTRFYLPLQKWFTIRIDFDLETSLANVAIVKMYNGFKCQQTDFLVVGSDLSLPTDAIRKLRFETCGPGCFFVDNVFMISRTEDLADDLKWRVPAREILTEFYPLRKDPIHLKTWSMRNIRFNCSGSGCPAGDELLEGDLKRNRGRQHAVILECAEKYNEIMIAQAFLGEKMRGLERAWVYSGNLLAEYKAQVKRAQVAVQRTEELLADLYEFYAECYLDQLNQEKMEEGFDGRYAALNDAIDSAWVFIQNITDRMRTEVIRRTQCRFLAYAIESPADTSRTGLKFSDGAFRRLDGKHDFIFCKANYMLWPSMEKILMLSPVYSLGAHHAFRDIAEPAFCTDSKDSYFFRAMNARSNEQTAVKIFYGMHYHESELPSWWAEKHKDEPDIFLCNSKGKSSLPSMLRGASSGGVYLQFNYWNADVLAAQKATLEALGDFLAKYGFGDRVSYIDMAQEVYFLITGPGGTYETGYNPSAVKAFRERLKKKYEDIDALNERWGSAYGSFEEIQPPEDWRLKPKRIPGLTYEFERFRQDSWHAWMKQCHVWLRDKLPGKVPNSCDISYPVLSSDCTDGLDSVKLFETFDIVMEHYQLRFAENPSVYRYLENLREAFKTSTGIGEWYVSADDIFDEQAIRNNGLRQAYQQVQWGRSVLVYWLGHDFCFLHNGNWTENRLGHTVLRYHSAYIPLSIARAKAHRAIYLECPLVQPDVGILESESSYYNVCGVREGMNGFAGLLHSNSHDYGFLFERLIMEGRQKLEDYKMIIMPDAACLPDKFVDKLLAWVKGGGVLLTTGAAGLMNEYGVKTGKLLNEVLGAGQWAYEDGKLSVKGGEPVKITVRDSASSSASSKKDTQGQKSRKTGQRPKAAAAQNSSQPPALVKESYGQGKVYLCVSPAADNEAMYEIISHHAPRKFYGKENLFHLAMREGKNGELYLSILNPDCYKRQEDEIVLKGEFRAIADIGNNFPILPLVRGGETSFRINLAPAEGVMIRIQK